MQPLDLVSYLSAVFGVLGVGIAFYQGFERKKLKEYVHAQSWHIYSMANNSSASIQGAFTSYKEAYKDNVNIEVVEKLAKCESFGVSLFMESIRQIHLSEDDFDIDQITSWIMQGKISREHAQYFIRMMPSESPSLIAIWMRYIILRRKQKLIAKIANTTNQSADQDPSADV